MKTGDKAMVTDIGGSREFKNYLIANGISLGSILTKNYSPRFSGLINFTVGGKMLSLRSADFDFIECVKIAE